MTISLNTHNTQLTKDEIEQLQEMRRRCVRRVLLSTSLAASGHPGGSLSALDLLLVAYGIIRHDPKQPLRDDRDRVVVSMGHISPGVYSVLSELGYFTEEDFLTGFRRAGSGFPGHVERIVPGVEWDTGNLGQGLSVGVGMALALKKKGSDRKVMVFMGDGEQQKGQISEAIRFARKFNLNNLIVIVDRNHLQICGETQCIMPQDVRGTYRCAGWNVHYLEDGHNYDAIFTTFSDVYNGKVPEPSGPSVIVARTTMGKGISFMENLAKYHGSPLKSDQLTKALAEIGCENDYDAWAAKRLQPVNTDTIMVSAAVHPKIDAGRPLVYDSETLTDNRSAYGNALESLATANNINGGIPKIIGVSCDLEGSVKMGGFRKHMEEAFVETGIQEHHAATMAGALSREGLVTFFSTFGAFAVSEVYNQLRLNDINKTDLKVVATHVGLDVGEDGPTHQCIDYLGLLRNLCRFSVFLPADPNQTDRIVRYVAANQGNHFVGMGRSKTPVITKEDGKPFFDETYVFSPGRADWLRKGEAGTIITYGALVPEVMKAGQILLEDGIDVAVLNMASLVPFDVESVLAAADKGPIMTVEDHHVETGVGSMVGTALAEKGKSVPFKRLGVTRYASSGKPADLYAAQGLDAQGIVASFKEVMGKG